MMPKQKITISLDSDVAEKLRLQSIEKYHNARSMSRLIEDLATGAVKKEHESDAIKANREEYCRKFMEEQTKPICWPCGKGWIEFFVCKTCHCDFHAPIPDAKYCPACGNTDIVTWAKDIDYKSIDDIIDVLDHEKFSTPNWEQYRKHSGRYARRQDISKTNPSRPGC